MFRVIAIQGFLSLRIGIFKERQPALVGYKEGCFAPEQSAIFN
jgi:hypothetical protein